MNVLTEIIAHKQTEIATLSIDPDGFYLPKNNNKSFKRQLLQPNQVAIIAEIKRKSPSKGELAAIAKPLELAEKYIQGGANCLSILTDQKYFGGSLADLQQISQSLINTPVAILRKDFIIDCKQIIESLQAGADAILLIVAAIEQKTAALLQFAKRLNLDVLVEVHDEQELRYALEIGADIIGVNTRNLKTFEVDLNRAFELISFIPKDVIAVAESGIRTSHDAKALYAAGYHALLIGEALVLSEQPDILLQQMRGII